MFLVLLEKLLIITEPDYYDDWLVGTIVPNRADFKTNNQVTIMIGFCFTQWITLW